MIHAVIRRLPLMAWCLGAAALASGCEAASVPAVTYAHYTVTCCQSSDVNQLYHPGEALVVHWIVSPSTRTASDAAITLTLSVTLQGAYASVPTLKIGGPAAYTLHAAEVTTTDRSPTAPTSVIQLPADLPPGYYNLATKVAMPDDNSVGGASVVQVTS
jgi:methionine-rich copper-binding protein CopC